MSAQIENYEPTKTMLSNYNAFILMGLLGAFFIPKSYITKLIATFGVLGLKALVFQNILCFKIYSKILIKP